MTNYKVTLTEEALVRSTYIDNYIRISSLVYLLMTYLIYYKVLFVPTYALVFKLY